MYEQLYQRKYQYEKLIKDLEECYTKLEKYYSNLLLCRNKVRNTVMIDDNYYNYHEFEKVIDNIERDRDKIKDIVLPSARYKYNEIVSEISKF